MIPKILWQTWKNKEVPAKLKHMVDSWATHAPELDRRFMDDQEAADFILEYFGKETYDLYMAFPQPIMRADFWRLAVVYIHGGYYADLDVILHQRFFDFIPDDIDAIFTKEINNIANWFLGSKPNNPAIKAALDHMLFMAKLGSNAYNNDVQNFGMHPIHRSVQDFYSLDISKAQLDYNVFLWKDVSREQKGLTTIQHISATETIHSNYPSWRKSQMIMQKAREESQPILFFTTFHKTGYELYGKSWVSSFIELANYYTKFKAQIYYQGFDPDIEHPNIEWIDYDLTFPEHPTWKFKYLSKTKHSAFVKNNTVRFSHKAFVIAHVLSTYSDEYMVWLDGDVVFKKDSYESFPKELLQDRFLACQLEHGSNHVESGILIFKGDHQDTKKFAVQFKKFYEIDHLLTMGEPYDGYIVHKTIFSLGLPVINLNAQHGRHGIQSDPNETFLHPDIKSRFTHNIGPTGKKQYDSWDEVKHKTNYIRDINKNVRKVVLISGGFDPLHSGHIAYMEAAKKLGQVLCVGLNSDEWLIRKKGKNFMSWKERSKIIRSLKMVDYVIDFDDSDNTAKDAIRQTRLIFPSARIVFANGGDRTSENIPEQDVDVRGVSFVFGVGGKDKMNSSSDILQDWEQWIKNK